MRALAMNATKIHTAVMMMSCIASSRVSVPATAAVAVSVAEPMRNGMTRVIAVVRSADTTITR